MENLFGNLNSRPRVSLASTPTPVEPMPNLTAHFSRAGLFIKRDDFTGIGLGGNKARQLEFYFGEALAKNADTILITGATQSNFARLTATAARKCGMECHIQVEQRVPNTSPLYHHSGNVLLSRMLGATLHSFPEGEAEDAADANLEAIADRLRNEGRNPYVIHLAPNHPPFGALGYVMAARELFEQIENQQLDIDEIIVASGSGATHAGLLFGLRTLGSNIPVKGICVRREKQLQFPRIAGHCKGIAKLLEISNPVKERDIDLNDDLLPPGYGRMNDAVLDAIKQIAHCEGIILDPVYTGRTMAGFLGRVKQSSKNQNLLFIHTGGQPSNFAYEEQLEPILSNNI